MSRTHDEITNLIGEFILKNIREENPNWKQVFTSNVHRIGDWDWPRPDYIIRDENLNVTYAHEFKPPNQNKREYLTGLGQSISYLQRHNYSGLIVPKFADDGFNISSFVNNTLTSDEFKHLPISLIEYDEDLIYSSPLESIKILKTIDTERASSVSVTSDQNKTFWLYWRDASHYEVFQLLNLSYKYSEESGDIYTNFIYEEFYEMLVSSHTKQWNGNPRMKIRSERSKASEKQNYKIPLFQLGLWNQADGRLTRIGYRLLVIGKRFGPNSNEFIEYLTYLILIEGKHLQLIHHIRDFQKQNEGDIPEKSDDFLINLEHYLSDKGLIGDRKPTAVTTGAKPSYIRDEPKLWNHLGLLQKITSTQYFIPSVGYRFNWHKISSILVKDYSKLL